MKVGVLALQGAFREHREVVEVLGAACVEVRTAGDLAGLDCIILPGGESTTIDRLLDTSGVREPLGRELRDGMPVFGTCAGLIVCAREVLDGRPDQVPFGVLDVSVRRNAYGTQQQSFEVGLAVDGLGRDPFPGVFIRAPAIDGVGPDVEVLAIHEGRTVLCRQGAVWGATFHPELSGDVRIHELFLAQRQDPGATVITDPRAERGNHP